MPLLSAPPRPLACALVVALGCAAVQPAGDDPAIRRLEIEGNRAVPDLSLRARILTAETSWLPFSEKKYLDEAALETDLKRILRLYQARGFYKARIVERKVTPAGGKRVDVLIRIDEGPPTRVSELLLEGIDDLPTQDQRRLAAGLPLLPGGVFAEEAYDALTTALADWLRESGFAEAAVEGVVQVDLASDQAVVTVGVDHGPRFRFGQVFVAGANRVPRKQLSGLAREAIPQGALYRESALAEAQARIFDLGVFSGVKVTRGAPDRLEGTVPVVVTVREAPFRTLRVGAGVGIDNGRTELPRASAEWTNRNFFGGLRKLSFENRASLVFTRSIFAGGLTDESRKGPAFESSLTFQQPEFFARDLDLTSSVGVERDLDQSFEFLSANGSAGLLWRLGRRLTLVPTFNLSVFNLNGEATDAARATGREAFLDTCPRADDRSDGLCVRVLSYLEQRLTWDRRDNPVEPTRGTLVSISLQEGSRFLGSDYDYLRLLPEARAYLPVGRHVLAVRLMAGLLRPVGDQPSSVLTRFFLGGSDSQRGFGSRELSPRLTVLLDPEDRTAERNTEALPVGGNGMVAANVEARFTLPADFGLVTFLDAGEVKPTVGELSIRDLHLAAGVGLRYRTLFGPVRLDFAYRVSQVGRGNGDPLRPGYPGVAVQPLPGTDEEILAALNPPGTDPAVGRVLLPGISRFSIHFSIGEAF